MAHVVFFDVLYDSSKFVKLFFLHNLLFVFRLIDQQITSIDLASFTRKLRQVRERLGRTQGSIVGPAIDNEALFLDQMEQVKILQIEVINYVLVIIGT